MGIKNLLKSTLSYLEQHGPEIADRMQRTLERQQEEIDKYKAKYSDMSNQELQNRVDQGVSGAERAALASIAQERKLERETYQEQCSTMSSFELMVEYKTVSRKKREQDIGMREAELKLAIISRILKDRGYYLNSDLEWSKK